MPTSRTYARCRNCGAHRDDGASLSKRGLCEGCGALLLVENMEGIHTKTGRAWARWQIGMAVAALRDPRLVNALVDAGAFAYEVPSAAPPLDDSGDSE